MLELLTSELITNGLVHARSELELTAQLDRTGLRVAVSDLDTRCPVLFPQAENAMGGRSLALIDTLAADWGVDDLPDGKASGSGSDSQTLPNRGHRCRRRLQGRRYLAVRSATGSLAQGPEWASQLEERLTDTIEDCWVKRPSWSP